MLLLFFSILKIASPEGKHFSHLLKSWEDGFEKLSAYPNESLIFTKRTSFSCPPPLHIWGIFSVLESHGWFPRPQRGFRSLYRHRCIFYWNEKQLNKANLMADLWGEMVVVLWRVMVPQAETWFCCSWIWGSRALISTVELKALS